MFTPKLPTAALIYSTTFVKIRPWCTNFKFPHVTLEKVVMKFFKTLRFSYKI